MPIVIESISCKKSKDSQGGPAPDHLNAKQLNVTPTAHIVGFPDTWHLAVSEPQSRHEYLCQLSRRNIQGG